MLSSTGSRALGRRVVTEAEVEVRDTVASGAEACRIIRGL